MKIKLDEKGRIVIPYLIRQALDIKPKDEVKVELIENKMIIAKP